MSELTLEQLFDSPIRTRLLKLFLRNSEKAFALAEIRRHVRMGGSRLNRELQRMLRMDFIKAKFVKKQENAQKRRKKKPAKIKVYAVNQAFGFYPELKSLALKSAPAPKKKMLEKLARIGRVRLVALAGVFIGSDKSRADLMIVGDNMPQRKLSNFIKDLEAEIGKEINYAAMSTKEFYYRYDMYDRFVRDMLEYPHEKLVNKLKI